MQSAIFLLLGIHLVYAGKHSLQYFYTATSGLPNFPQFVTVGIVDEQPFTYYDSKIRRETPRQEWIAKSEGEDYWEQETQKSIGSEQVYINGINIVKERFNQTGGVHTVQLMYGCELEDDGTTRGYLQYGYDGEDFLILDKSTRTWTAANPQAVITKHKWDATGAEANYWKGYLENTCIEWVNKYVSYGKETLERTDAPKVSLLQKDSSSPVICHATGFYPNNIMMTWKKNQDDRDEDVDVSSTLPNEDGSFQKSISLSVKPDEWKKNPDVYRCVVQHVGAEKEIVVLLNDNNVRINPDSDNITNIIGIVVGCLVALALLGAIIGLFMWKRSNGYGKASTKDSDSENSDQPLPKA